MTNNDKTIGPHLQERVSTPNVVLQQPASRPVEGSPIGNGRMGTLVWTTPGTVEFQINRVDVFAVNRETRGKTFCLLRLLESGSAAGASTDYGGACARVSIAVGSELFRAGPLFAQRLSLADARCEVRGEDLHVSCWVAAETDALVVEVKDERESPQPIEVKLAMWREPEVKIDGHTAAYSWRGENGHGDHRAAIADWPAGRGPVAHPGPFSEGCRCRRYGCFGAAHGRTLRTMSVVA